MAKRAKPPAKKAQTKRPKAASGDGRSYNVVPLKPAALARELLTLLDLVRFAVSRFVEARLTFAHGTTDPMAEAVFLVCEALHLHPDQFDMLATARVTH